MNDNDGCHAARAINQEEQLWSDAFLNVFIEKGKKSGLWDQKYLVSISISSYFILNKCKGITAPSKQIS